MSTQEETPLEENVTGDTDNVDNTEDDDVGLFKSMNWSVLIWVITSLIVIWAFYTYFVKPSLTPVEHAPSSVIEDSNKEGYWHERFGY